MLHTTHQNDSANNRTGKFDLKSEIDTKSLSSVTLSRLVQEVKNSDPMVYGAFDRVHNKHNR